MGNLLRKRANADLFVCKHDEQACINDALVLRKPKVAAEDAY